MVSTLKNLTTMLTFWLSLILLVMNFGLGKMKNKEEDTDRKSTRREKIKKKNLRKDFSFDDENQEKNHLHKKELKKIKEEFEDEEWEDWDRYYNH